MSQNTIDAVITYVDGNDPSWRESYAQAVGGAMLDKRFRDWGTLKYLLRGIENCMPFVDKVFLVVSSVSQVPAWVDRERLRIVLHEDIIPERFLPVFNSTAIEMFLPCIGGLSERFIYFNDDMFPLSPCSVEDFFMGDKAVGKPAKELLALNMYKIQSRNSSNAARQAAGLPASLFFLRPQHCPAAMLLSACREVSRKAAPQIERSVSRTREKKNLNQYLFIDYAYYKHLMIHKRLSCKHLSLAVAGLQEIRDCILSPSCKFACINDVHLSEDKYTQYREGILSAFESRFPLKSRFENSLQDF